MMEDRDYMKARPYRNAWSLTKTLTVILAVIYALQCINDVYLHTRVELWLALTPDCLKHGWLWQLFTFQFLHASLWHLAGNLMGFWWTGHFVENILGKRRFLIALFGCGLVGGLLQGLLMVLFHGVYGLAVVGASAGIAGLLAIFALLEKESTIRLNFILPIPAITFLWIFGGVSLFFTLVPTPRELGMAHAAHLGGLLAGVCWVKLGWHHDFVPLPWESWLAKLRRGNSKPASTQAQKLPPWARVEPAQKAATRPEEFISREVDPILDKISAHGMQSLTEQERKTLEAARGKMGKL